jgi:hypothetical protein
VRREEELAGRYWGLAREIKFLREQFAEVNGQVMEARARKNDTELFLQDQLWSILSRTAELKDALNNGGFALYSRFAEFVASGIQVLRQHSNEAYIHDRELGEAQSQRETRRLLLVRLNETRSESKRNGCVEIDKSKFSECENSEIDEGIWQL